MDELGFALDTIDGRAFEDFAMAFLREEGYKIHESGGTGPDGGWDARVEMGSRHGISHVSKRKDWRRKLREDAKKVKELEDDRSEEYDLFVFVTSQEVQGNQQLEMKTRFERSTAGRSKSIIETISWERSDRISNSWRTTT